MGWRSALMPLALALSRVPTVSLPFALPHHQNQAWSMHCAPGTAQSAGRRAGIGPALMRPVRTLPGEPCAGMPRAQEGFLGAVTLAYL